MLCAAARARNGDPPRRTSQDAEEVQRGADILQQQTATLDSVVEQVAVRACVRLDCVARAPRF